MTPRLLRAYRQTIYRVDNIAFRVGYRCAAIDDLLREYGTRTAVLITAHNPYSHRMPDGWNARMQAGLAERLRRRPVLYGSGTGCGWSETHILVFGAPAPIVRLAREMRQNGIVILRAGQPVRLRLLLSAPVRVA
ncbi:MAG: hypothetical protein B7Z80_18450 [Rhodospirillales bacterium 20-64-7]|nr:MAG: hypothetical protein B7Z80_18450 [Rhodospirillales bacterium 20-64-7]HQT76903.1 DUF3293 domain-containing protein [Rhodopila sp.]